MTRRTIVRYQVKPGEGDHNEELVRAVYREPALASFRALAARTYHDQVLLLEARVVG